MVVPLIPLAIISFLGLIALMTGTYFISCKVVDITTGESTPVELAKEENINVILNRLAAGEITFEEAMALLEAMRKDDPSEWEELMHKLLIIVAVIALAYVAATYMKER